MFPVFILLLLCLSICVLAAADLQPSSFSNDVVGSERVWLVEFYSAMCGSCKEFAPTWEKIEFSLKSKLSLGKVNIDDQESMKLAQSLGVLDEGIPCIRIFSSKSSDKGASIMSGDLLSSKAIIGKIKKNITGLQKDEEGFYVKSS